MITVVTTDCIRGKKVEETLGLVQRGASDALY